MMTEDGSTVDYFYLNKKIYPLKGENLIPDIQKKGISISQEGIMLFSYLFSKLNTSVKQSALNKRDEINKIFKRLTNVPTHSEKALLDNLLSEDFGSYFKVSIYDKDFSDKLNQLKIYYKFGDNIRILDYGINEYYKILIQLIKNNCKEVVLFGLSNITENLLNILFGFGINVNSIFVKEREFTGLTIYNVSVKFIDEIRNIEDQTPIIICTEKYQDIVALSIIEKFQAVEKSYSIIKTTSKIKGAL